MLIDNRNKFGILRGTNKRIFTTSGNRAQFTGVEDDHKPFERKGEYKPVLNVALNIHYIIKLNNMRT